MAGDTRGPSSLFRRAEQLRRWQESETNKQEVSEKVKKRKVKFSDGCIFLAAGAAGDKDELKRLLEKGADINTVNQDGITALHAACIDNNLEIVEFLVDNNADINRCDMEGWTPLHATASCGSLSMAEFLISRGADLSVVNNDGELAIDVVDEDDMAKLLQEEMDRRGIDCDASRSREERHMLEDAQHWHNYGQILEKPHPKTGATALHVASAKGYIPVLRMLIDSGADVHAKDLDGWTPLHAATHWGQTNAVEILCDNMADMDVLNSVGQSPYDLADDTMKGLMDELRKKQLLIQVGKSKKRKTSPHKDRSNKKEKDSLRGESDGTSSSDESTSLDVEKRTTSNRDSTLVDLTEVQSWRRPSLRNKILNEHRNSKEETTKSIPIAPSLHNNKDDEVILRKDSTSNSEDRMDVLSSEHRQKALSCLSLSPSSGINKDGGKWRETLNTNGTLPNHILNINSSRQTLPTSSLRRTISLSSDVFTPNSAKVTFVSPKETTIISSSSQIPSSSSVTFVTSLTTTVSTVSSSLTTNTNSSVNFLRRTNSLSENLNFKTPSSWKPKSRNSSVEFTLPSNDYDRQETLLTSSCQSSPSLFSEPSSPPDLPPSTSTSLLSSNQRLSGTELASKPAVSTPSNTSSFSSPSVSNISNNIVTTTSTFIKPVTTIRIRPKTQNRHFLLSPHPSENVSSTNIINKNPEVLARSQSLKARIQRNCQDILKIQDNNYVTTPQSITSNSIISTSPSKPTSRSFVPPSRDDESETQRKAHAKLVRSTRRSTQGITLEDVKSAEQFIKTKQVLPNVSSDSNTATSATTTTTITSSIHSASDLPNSVSDTNTANSSASNKDSSFSQESSCTKDRTKVEVENEIECTTVTLPLRKKSISEEKKDDKLDDKSATTREGTQAVIQRRKKAKRRSTGVVHVDIDDIDPDKKETNEVIKGDVVSVSEREGSSSKASSQNHSRSVSRSSSVVGAHNGDIDYKKLYEEQLSENDKLMERLRSHEKELRHAKETIDSNSKTVNARSLMAETERREKRSLERKLAEMEEELRELEQLRQENQRLKDENGALIRVISKLSR